MLHAEFHLLLFGADGEPILAELEPHAASSHRRLCFSGAGPGEIISLASISITALGFWVSAWIKARANRQVKIVLKDGTQIEAKGMSAQELAEHLAVAVAAELHQPRSCAQEKE